MNRSDAVVLMLLCLLSPLVAFCAPATKGSRGVAATQQKLDGIRIPEIAYDGLTLAEVAVDLSAQAARHDPDGRGVKIVISPAKVGASIPGGLVVLDPRGQAIGVVRRRDLSQAMVYLKFPLFGLTLRQALAAVALTCDQSVKYVVSDQGVEFQSDDSRRPLIKAVKNAGANSNAKRIRTELKKTRVPLVQYDGLMLEDVVRDLMQQTRGKRINFLFAPSRGNPKSPAAGGAPVLDAMGNPIAFPTLPGSGALGRGLSTVIVNLKQPLKNLSLEGTLDAIVNMADQPINWSVEDYGVVFEVAGPKEQPVVTQFFHVESARVMAKLDDLSGETPKDRSGLSRQLRAYLFAAGIESMSERESRTRLFFNHENGRILIRAVKDDIQRIERALKRLNTP